MQDDEKFKYVKEQIKKPVFQDRIRKKAGILFIVFIIITIGVAILLHNLNKTDNHNGITEEITSGIKANEDNNNIEKTLTREELIEVSNQTLELLVTVHAYVKHDGRIIKNLSSGIIIKNGVNTLILTDYNSIKDAYKIEIIYQYSLYADAYIKQVNEEFNIAILSISDNKINNKMKELEVEAIKFSSNYSKNMQVFYIGNPINESPYIFYGNVANMINQKCLDGEVTVMDTDIMYVGNNTGFIIDSKGDLAGLVGMVESGKDFRAIKSIEIIPTINKLINNVKRPLIGIMGDTITNEIKESSGQDLPDGVYIHEVDMDSPAYLAGIRNGDIITNIGNEPIVKLSDIRIKLDELSIGDKIIITIMRKDGGKYEKYEYKIEL